MPNASKYIIDVANIRPGGKPIKGLYVGSSEKKYATLGNKCIYDKVLYELSINNITNVEPNAQTVTISSYTSKRTHGNGAVDTLYINPSTKQVTANTSTANTKDTTVVVNQALTLNGTTTGTGVTVTITQMKDYPIGLTLTISPKSIIPASGGYISSALTNYTYSVKANYKSGNNNVDVTSNAATTITANVTGVTASSKGTTASNATTAGTIRFTASYTCNGKTVTTTTDVNITQDKNEVVSYANPTFTLTPSSNQTLPASGGKVTASVSNVQQVRTWSSNSTDTFSPSYTTTWNAQTISCDSRGTVTGDALTLGTTTATVTANGKSTTKSYVVYQQANAVTSTTWGDITGTPTGSCSDISAGGGTVTATTTTPQTLAQNYKYNYTSGSQDANWKSTNVSCSVSYAGGNTATASSLGTTVKDRTHVATLTVRASANGKTKDGSVYVYQQANKLGTTPLWGDLSLTAVTLSCADVPAGGGTVTPSWSGQVKQNRRYQYTSGSYSIWELVNITPVSVSWSSTSISGGNLGTTVKDRTSLGTVTATFTGNNSKTAAKTLTVYQQANAITNYDYSASNINYWASCSIGDGLTAAGGSASVSASAGHTHVYYYYYTSTSTSGPYYSYPSDGVSISIITNGNNRFSYSNGTITHSSMGTNVTTDTVTIRATNNANTSATGDASKSIDNAVTNSDYNASNYDYWASCSIGDGLTAAGGSASVSASAGHTHKYYYLYTSQSTSGPYYSYPGDGVSISIITNGNNRFSYSNGTITHSSMGTNVTTDTITIRATNNANGSIADASKSIDNAVTNYDYSASNYDYWASCSIGDGLTAAGGSASVSASAGHTHKYYYLYTSTSTSEPYYSYPGDGVSTSMIRNDNDRFSYSNGTITHSSMRDNVTTDTVTIRATNNANGSTADASKSIVNEVSNTTYSNPVVTVPSNQSVTSASGYIDLSNSNTKAEQDSSFTYTSGLKVTVNKNYWISGDDATWTATSDNTGFTATKTKVSWGENTSTSSRSATITVSCTVNGKTGSNSFTITQSGQSFKFTIKNNSSTYGLYGSFGSITPTGQMVSGDFPSGTNRTVDMTSGTVVLTDYSGAVQPSKTSGTVKFECSGAGGGTMSGNIQSNGNVNLTGALTVKNGTTITITIS